MLHRPGRSAAAPELIARGRDALLAVRATRTRPARDEKRLAAWNGLALRALAHAALVLGDDRYAEATADLVTFVRRDLLREGAPVRVWRTSRDGRSHTPGFAEDHLALADGFLAAHAALGRADDLALALDLARAAIEMFWDDAAGTFVDVGEEHGRTIATPRGLVDNALPSANSIGADVLLRLALLTGDDRLAERARSILRAGTRDGILRWRSSIAPVRWSPWPGRDAARRTAASRRSCGSSWARRRAPPPP